jgi:hypothetical protein
MGAKIMNENIIGSALTQSEVSRYNPASNRCYVDLQVSSADLSKFETSSDYLYDGQTGEMLAWKKVHLSKRTGSISAADLIPANKRGDTDYTYSYETAEDLIDRLMKEDRLPATAALAK